MPGLVIREAQLKALAEAATDEFVATAAAHLTEHYPRTSNLLGEIGLKDAIRRGLAKARRYGIDDEYDALRFLNLMFALGFEFDSDPKYPWARHYLTDSSYGPRAKLDAVTQFALETTQPEGADSQQ